MNANQTMNWLVPNLQPITALQDWLSPRPFTYVHTGLRDVSGFEAAQ